MIDHLETKAEKRAQKAEELPAFSGIKLLHIKRQVDELLGLIGRDGIFDEYTKHDISHIDEMLKILDWLIPEDTKDIMSPADWLITVLAIYFHDLGMLVTKEEYEQRNSSGYIEYRDKVLFADDYGADYRAKVNQLSSDESERFLYQDFVRGHHAERIRNWIMGRASVQLGITPDSMSEVTDLLSTLDSQFRRDLALVCESHHLNDLNNFEKYKVSQPYGNSDKETANIQYAAVLLRTADLLHITRDRTPSVAFRIINPTDPLSQKEWVKQMAVRRVRSQISRDRENNPDENADRDTIEVHAHFTQESGFFGLTSYLSYAQNQIQKSYGWVKEANERQGARHTFPWRYVDDNNIETEGFLRDKFEFTIDQAKILDLLTGHTLYNDTSVVLRELVQNAFDAIRIQQLIDQQADSTQTPGKVTIHWDSKERVLSVEDNGTGMTQEIIVQHLLRVGSSRYQSPDFKRQYPDFSPISRFGIGLLSAFMVADTVEIITCNTDEDKARHLSLRSVHGKYLIRLLDKQTYEIANHLAPHGTSVKLKVRPSAEISDIIETAKKWIVVPGCEVNITVDSDPPVQVGFSSPKDAVKDVLQNIGASFDGDSGHLDIRKLRIEEKEMDGVTLAYALEWSEFFKEWSFLHASSDRLKELKLFFGTCIGGVRVDVNTPGFDDNWIVAIANADGVNAPKTNVVRSGLEATPERDAMLRSIYSLYCDHVKTEMEELYEKRQFSLTWATQEARYLLSPLLHLARHEFQPLNTSLLIEIARKLPVLMVEKDNQRQAIAPEEFSHEPLFWTIDCALFRSAELIIREVASPASLSNLIKTLHADNVQLPIDPILCGFNTYNLLDISVFGEIEVDKIGVYPEQRRVDLRWVTKKDPPRCRRIPDELLDIYISAASMHNRFVRVRKLDMIICQDDVEVSGMSDEIAVRAFDIIYLLPDSQIAKYLISWLDRFQIERNDEDYMMVYFITFLIFEIFDNRMQISNIENILDRFEQGHQNEYQRLINSRGTLRIRDIIDPMELNDIIEGTNWKIFDPSAWVRGDQF
jgi:Histidine kinase-, DNA gyrase B-, and HSP90-like ATPase